MSKRTKLKLRNIRMYFTKYVFNGRYVVRNILAATVLATIAVLIVGASMALGDVKKKKLAESAEAEKTVINAYEITAIDSESISILKADLEGNTQAIVEANNTQMVSGATNEFDSKFVATSDDINIREMSDMDSNVVGKLNNGAVGDIVSSDGEWLKITSGNVNGFVKAEFVLTGKDAAEYAKDFYTVTGTIIDDDVCVRAEASKEADMIETAYRDSTYNVDKTATTDEWVCVSTADDGKGYIYSEYVTVVEGYPTAIAVINEDEEDENDSESDEKDNEDVSDESDNSSNDNSNSSDENNNNSSDNNSSDTQATTTEEDKKPADNETTVATTNRGAISLSDADINLMASVLTLECGGESYEGQLAVANVIINRMQSGYWGSTVSDVVYAPSQFSVVSSSQLDYYIENGAQSSCIEAVKEAISGVNNIGSYTSFKPNWNVDTSSLGSYTIIGNHVFY